MYFFSILALSELLTYLVLVIIYCMILRSMLIVNKDIIQYATDHSCSDGVLQHSFKVFMDNFKHDVGVVSAGLFFSLLSMTIQITVMICFSPLRAKIAECCKGRLDSWKEPPKFEQKLAEVKDDIQEGYKNMIQRSIMAMVAKKLAEKKEADERAAAEAAALAAAIAEGGPLLLNDIHPLVEGDEDGKLVRVQTFKSLKRQGTNKSRRKSRLSKGTLRESQANLIGVFQSGANIGTTFADPGAFKYTLGIGG